MSRLLVYVVAGGVVVLDQVAKWLVLRAMPAGESWPVLGPYLSITLRYNPGAAFSLFPSATTALAIIAILTIVLIATYGIRLARADGVISAGLALALGGAIGNLLDRLRLGHVVDFVDVHFWPVFNIADIAITGGAILIVIALVRRHRHGETPKHLPQ